jgi:hypothetical protein
MTVQDYRVKEGFWNTLSSGDNIKEASQKVSNFIRLQIEEEGFARKILSPQPVTPAECVRSLTQDEFTYIVDFPPTTKAGLYTWTGESGYQTVFGKRAAIPFVTVSTEWQQWHKRQFMAYPYGIEEYIKSTFAVRLQTVEDWYLLTLTEAALAVSSKVVKGVAITESGAASGVFTKEDMINLKKQLTNKMVGRLVLLPATNVADMGLWQMTDLGRDIMNTADKTGEEAFLPGYYGLGWIRTIKEDLLKPGNIYLYGPQEYLGLFLTLGGIDFNVERHGNYIKMAADYALLMCIANTNAVAKLELYSGSSQTLPSWKDIHNQPDTTPQYQVTSL